MTLSLAACGGNSGDTEDTSGSDAAGEVYYLNFKPEADDQWQELAKLYTEETGVPVTVVTAASNTYEQNLTSDMAKDNPPTLFHVNGQNGLLNWKDSVSYTHLFERLTQRCRAGMAAGRA